MKQVRKMTAIAIGLWALNQPRWSCNSGEQGRHKEDWQGRGKRKKPRIK